MKELAERAIKAGWEWMPGSLSLPDNKGRTWRKTKTGWIPESGSRVGPCGLACELLPDFTDPATLGCLRHQAALAHGYDFLPVGDIVIQVDIQPRIRPWVGNPRTSLPRGEETHGWWGAIDSKGRKIAGALGNFICPNDGTDIRVLGLIAALEAAE